MCSSDLKKVKAFSVVQVVIRIGINSAKVLLALRKKDMLIVRSAENIILVMFTATVIMLGNAI